MKNHAAIAACAALIALGGVASAIDVPLTYESVSDGPRAEYRPYGFSHLELSPDMPAGDWKLPELAGKPLYGTMQLGDERRLVIVAKEREKDQFFNRMYFDANGNGDLTDDPVVKATDGGPSGPSFRQAMFPAIDTTVKTGEANLPFRFQPSVRSFFNASGSNREEEMLRNVDAYYQTRCVYSGEFEADGQAYRIYLGDENGNGQFGDKLERRDMQADDPVKRVYWGGDTVYVCDAANKLEYYDELKMGGHLLLKDRLHTVELAPDHSKLTLTPVEGALAALRLGPSVERMQLVADDGSSVLMYHPEVQVHIPAGKYRLVSYELMRRTESNDVWRLNAAGTENCPAVEVAKGSTTVLTFGEPFRTTVFVPRYSLDQYHSGSNQVQLSFNVLGAAHEVLADLSRVSGKSTAVEMASGSEETRPKQPAFRVVTADGEVVHSGRFEYG